MSSNKKKLYVRDDQSDNVSGLLGLFGSDDPKKCKLCNRRAARHKRKVQKEGQSFIVVVQNDASP